MSENLMDSVAPQLAAPVTRDRIRSAAEADGDVMASIVTIGPITITFADDSAE
ncbi:MAG: hypothetical protein QOG56_1725 [Solirubrobacteraceae bacterium]|jgi:hypothetical protein|nr:hypothetical protein [Solirubrobacteraceae bacterium]